MGVVEGSPRSASVSVTVVFLDEGATSPALYADGEFNVVMNGEVSSNVRWIIHCVSVVPIPFWVGVEHPELLRCTDMVSQWMRDAV